MPLPRTPSPPWWQGSVVYQIYPRSFSDSDGDGVGDLKGITARLDHLVDLGVDVVWLSPVYASPNDDNGYDISDYRAIQPEFGTMADFDELLAAMHARGLRLVMDLVVNHTSDEHAWFRRARRSRDDPFHDFYLWGEPREDGGPPTNWSSVFGGSAWAWNEATGEYFLHMFSRRQPDLNWENPAVRAEVFALMRFWLDKGVDGFRMDVINLISKRHGPDGRLRDAPVTQPGFLQSAWEMTANGPRLMEFLQEMKREVLAGREVLTVGEAPGATPELARALTDADGGVMNMLFQFDHVGLDQQPGGSKWDLMPLDVVALKQCLARWQDALADVGWNSLYLNNHDQPRAVSRWGDGSVLAAQCLAVLTHGQRGTPFVYQGEELGMANFPFTDIGQCRDIETLNWYDEAVHRLGWPVEAAMHAIRAKGRDNARTPMQWSAAEGAGFTQGTPWLAIHPNHRHVNREAQLEDPHSVLAFYRRLIRLRREVPALEEGRFALLLESHPQVFAFTRRTAGDTLLVACNLSPRTAWLAWPSGHDPVGAEVLISNRDAPLAGALRPWEAFIVRLPR